MHNVRTTNMFASIIIYGRTKCWQSMHRNTRARSRVSTKKMPESSNFNARVISKKTRGRPSPDSSTGLATNNSVSGPLLTTATLRGRNSSICSRFENAFCLLGSIIFLPSACTMNKSTSQFLPCFVVKRPYES